MIILINGASHTGKTFLAQKLLEKYKYPYYSLDHLKMGLIRSGQTQLTPEDDDQLATYIWPIVREIIKTAIENKQNLIIEGVYIPFDWQKDFEDEYLKKIKYICLIMSQNYIENHFDQIIKYADVVENRLEDGWTKEECLRENHKMLDLTKKYHQRFILIDREYEINLDKMFHFSN